MKKIFQSKWLFPTAFLITLTAFILSLTMPMATPSSVVVAFDTSGGAPVEMVTLSGGGKLESIPSTSKAGYDFQGWLKGSEVVTLQTVFTTNTTVRAKFDVLTYTIIYQTNGGSVLSDDVVEHGDKLSLPMPVKTNAIFLGWFEDQSLTVPFDEMMKVTKDYTLYAKWATLGLDLINVTYFSEGLGLIGSENVSPETLFSLPIPTREGYTFRYWVNGNTLTPIVGATTTVSVSTIFFAEWTSNAGLVTINFDSQGGTPIAPIQVPKGSSWANPENIPFLSEGYQFLNWITDCRYDGFEVTCTTLDGNYIVEENMTVLARYDYMIPLSSMRFESETKDGRIIGYRLSSINDFFSEETISTLILPSRFSGLPVVSIGSEVFSDIPFLDKVIIPENVIEINDSAFANSSIKEIYLPASLEIIDANAFENTELELVDFKPESKLREIHYQAFKATALTSIDIPQTVQYIGSGVFEDSTLEAIHFQTPSQLKFIGSVSFQNTLLTDITLPEGLREINSRAFYGVETLKKAHIPASVFRINTEAFAFTGLTEVTFGNNSVLEVIGTDIFGGKNDFVPFVENSSDEFVMAGPVLIHYKGPYNDPSDFTIPSQTRVVLNTVLDGSLFSRGRLIVPDTLKMIGEYAFENASFGGDISLPNDIRISQYAFSQVTVDGDVTIGAAKVLSYNAFDMLKAKDVTLLPNPRGLTFGTEQSNEVLGSSMFQRAELDSLTIGEGYSRIPSGFTRYSKITTMTFPASISVFEFGSIGSTTLVNLTVLGTNPLLNVNREAIPSDARTSPWYLAQGAYVILRNNLFRVNTLQLTSPYNIVVPDHVLVLNEQSIDPSFSYNSIDIANVKYVSRDAAYSFNRSLNVIEPIIFDGISLFNARFSTNEAILFNAGRIALTNYRFDLDIHPDLNNIGFNQSFLRNITPYDNEGFKIFGNILLNYNPQFDLTPDDVTIPDVVEIIVNDAFSYIELQGPLTLNEGLRYIGGYSFNDSSMPNESLTFPSTLEFIGSAAFRSVKMKDIFIPASVKTILDQAFEDTDFETFAFEDSSNINVSQSIIGYIFDSNQVRKEYRQYISNGFFILDDILLAYSGYDRDVQVPEGVVNIASNAFEIRNDTIETITLPSTLRYISKDAFRDLVIIKNIDFSLVTSLNYIGQNAFSSSSLSTLVIAAPIVALSPNALNNMYYLSSYSLNMVNPLPLNLTTSADLFD